MDQGHGGPKLDISCREGAEEKIEKEKGDVGEMRGKVAGSERESDRESAV